MIKDMSPEQTAQAIDDDPNTIYLDVRTVSEFDEGHVPGAMNIPVLIRGADGMMTVNQAFPVVVQACIRRDARIIVGCKSGQRSAQAAEMLVHMGYTNVANMLGGFSGHPPPTEQIADTGWLGKGLPVECDSGPGKSYAELLAKTNA